MVIKATHAHVFAAPILTLMALTCAFDKAYAQGASDTSHATTPHVDTHGAGFFFSTGGTLIITSRMGWRVHPVTGATGGGCGAGAHCGIDYRAAVGTPIYSRHAGVVLANSNQGPAGNVVYVYYPAFHAVLALFHNSSVPVQVGQNVQAGTLLAISGNTGRSSGPHIHTEIQLLSKTFDGVDMMYSVDPSLFTAAIAAGRDLTNSRVIDGIIEATADRLNMPEMLLRRENSLGRIIDIATLNAAMPPSIDRVDPALHKEPEPERDAPKPIAVHFGPPPRQ